MINNPSGRTGADFITFYSAGRIMLAGDRAEVYNPQAQITEEESILGFSILPKDLNPFVHPPFILPILALVALLPYIWGFHAWAILLYILYGINAFILLRTVTQPKEQKILLGGIFLFFPAFVSVLNGQDSAILLLGASLWMYGLLYEDDRLAGIGLALTTIRPHVALVLALPFLFNRRKVWWWFLAGAAGLALFSILLIGIKGAVNFVNILQISASGEGYKTNEPAMLNLLGSLRRGFPFVSPDIFRFTSWIIYICAIALLCVVWLRSKRIYEKQIGLAVVVALFAAPHLHYHDLVLVLIPIICLVSIVIKRGILTSSTISCLPMAISWLLFASNFLAILKFSIPYLLEAWLIFALWFPDAIFLRKAKKI